MSQREEMRKMAEGKEKLLERLIEHIGQENYNTMLDQYNTMLDQTVPFGNGARLKPSTTKGDSSDE